MTHWNTGQDNLRRQRGFTLLELLIVISIMLVLMLLAIPSMISLKATANETSAIQSLQAIKQAQIQYNTTYPANGYACSLQALSGTPGQGAPSPTAAQILPTDLGGGTKAGYNFAITNCGKSSVNNQDQFTSYEATAVPQKVGQTGHRGDRGQQNRSDTHLRRPADGL